MATPSHTSRPPLSPRPTSAAPPARWVWPPARWPRWGWRTWDIWAATTSSCCTRPRPPSRSWRRRREIWRENRTDCSQSTSSWPQRWRGYSSLTRRTRLRERWVVRRWPADPAGRQQRIAIIRDKAHSSRLLCVCINVIGIKEIRLDCRTVKLQSGSWEHNKEKRPDLWSSQRCIYQNCKGFAEFNFMALLTALIVTLKEIIDDEISAGVEICDCYSASVSPLL